MTTDDIELESLARRLGDGLAACGWTLVAADSCTGGWIAKAVTDVPGSSRWSVAGYVVYSNEAKTATSLEVLQNCKLEPSLAEAAPGAHVQFERTG